MGTLSRVTAGMILITATVVVGSMTALALIKDGNKGEAVTKLQTKLKAKGYFSHRIDGSFGDKTKAAVRKFQGAKGLEVDGKVGDETWRKLTGQAERPILRRRTANRVSTKTLQGKLGINDDGKWGDDTEKEVIKYQKRKGIVPNGVVEADMRYMLGWISKD